MLKPEMTEMTEMTEMMVIFESFVNIKNFEIPKQFRFLESFGCRGRGPQSQIKVDMCLCV